MKRNDSILLIALAAYSYLFYEQQRGINFLIFSVLLIALLIVRNVSLIRQPAWIASAIGTLISAACVFIFGNQLSFIANAISICLLSAFSFNAATSLIVALLNALFSYVSGLIMICVDWLERKKVQAKTNNPLSVKLLLFIVPVIVLMVFFSLYKSSNPLFENFTQNINLDFISWNWVRFTLIGFVFLYAFFNQRMVTTLTNYDVGRSDGLQASTVTYKTFFGSSVKAEHEQQSGVILFALLNALLLVVNTLDVRYMWMGTVLPAGLTYSEFVHQGTGALITSIVFAEIIILFYFRGVLNFMSGNTIIKSLSYAWILQNIFMIVSTTYRNLLYVNEYSLTYKRIGVFVYLLLCVAGLMVTFIKIYKVKSNWFLFRKNGWIFYAILILAACFNWDVFITNYNIEMAEKKSKSLDKFYLTTMLPNNIPQLISMNESLQHKDMSDELTETSGSLFRSSESNDSDNETYMPQTQFNSVLSKSIYNFSKSEQSSDWQSYCYERQQISDGILNLNKINRIKSLDLSNGFYSTLKPVQYLNNITKLDYGVNQKTDLSELQAFPKLKILHLNNCKIDSLHNLPKLSNLKELNLSGNELNGLNALSIQQQLETLSLANNHLNNIDDLPALPNLVSLDLSLNNIASFTHLSLFAKLKQLNLSSATANSNLRFAPIPNLEEIDLSHNELSVTLNNLSTAFKDMKHLKILNLSSNNLSELDFCFDKTDLGNLPPVTELNLNVNSFSNFYEISFLTNLKVLSATENRFSTLTGIEQLTNLESLNLSDNKSLQHIESLSKNSNLNYLNLQGDSRIQNFNAISNLKQMENLNLSGTGFSDLVLLENLQKLKYLNLNNTSVGELQYIVKLTTLEELSLENCPVNDFKPLENMKQLKKLWLSDNVSAFVYRELTKALPNTKIYPQRSINSNL